MRHVYKWSEKFISVTGRKRKCDWQNRCTKQGPDKNTNISLIENNYIKRVYILFSYLFL